MELKSFTPSELQRNSSEVFNEVQSNGKAVIESKSRPAMTLILTSEFDAMKEKIRQLVDLTKTGDAHLQADLLK